MPTRKKDVIEFGKGGYFDNYSLNLTIQIDEMFIAVSDYENLQYADGELYYTGPSYVDKSIINIIAPIFISTPVLGIFFFVENNF